MPESFQCGLILLAAGESRRMGRPKQLLPIKGNPLVRHMAELVVQAPVSPVVVVLGANARKIEPVLHGLPIILAINPGWSEGLGSSLRAGLDAMLEKAPRLDAVIVALADQPTLPVRHLERLVKTFRQGGRTIVATQVGDARMPPALFAASWFPALGKLTGDSGARDLLRNHPDETAAVPLDTHSDLDTPEDYDEFTQSAK